MSNPHGATLDTLIAIGTVLAQDIQAARQANEITPTQAAEAFERVARATRRTILLAARLAHPTPEPAAAPGQNHQAARRELIRTVEDAITREARLDDPAKRALEAEFHERLDAPELAEDLAARPVAAVVTDILRDLDLGRLPFTEGPNWRRRTPAAIRRLHALAAGTVPEPEPRPGPAPPTPPGPEPGIPATLRQLHRHLLAAVAGEPPPPPH